MESSLQPPALATATADLKARLAAGHQVEIAALHQLDRRKRLAEMAAFAMMWLIGGAITLWSLHHIPAGPLQYGFRFAGSFLTAIALNACVLLQHEAMHHTLFQNRRANYFGGVILGGITLISFSAYKLMHLRHHAFLGDGRDPDDYGGYTDRRWLVWAMQMLRLIAGTFLYLVLIPFIAMPYATSAERRRIGLEYVALGLMYVLLALFVPPVFLIHAWLLPGVIVAAMTNVRGLIEHAFTDASSPELATRTMLPNPIVAFCILHINLHLEHHLWPKVPSYNLPKLHRIIWPQLPQAVTGRSYVAFVVRFFRAALRMDERPIGLVSLEKPERP